MTSSLGPEAFLTTGAEDIVSNVARAPTGMIMGKSHPGRGRRRSKPFFLSGIGIFDKLQVNVCNHVIISN